MKNYILLLTHPYIQSFKMVFSADIEYCMYAIQNYKTSEAYKMAVARAQSGNLFGEGSKLKEDTFANRQFLAIIAADDLLSCYQTMSPSLYVKEFVEFDMRTTIKNVLMHGKSMIRSYADVVKNWKH